MKKLTRLFSIGLLATAAALVFTATPVLAHEGCCSSEQHKAEKPSTTKTAQAGQTYTCTMHPEVVSDKPGKCPKCGMDLVVKKPEAKAPAKK